MTGINPGAEWYRDPTRRAEYRYWDGSTWSQWVSDAGVSRADDQPLAPDLPPPPPLMPPGYPAPSAAQPYPVATHAAGARRFASLKGLWVALAWLLGIELLIALALAGTVINRMVKLNHFEQTPTFTAITDYRNADDAVNAVQGWMFIVGIAVFVLVIIFMFRASKNTSLWRTDHQTWAAGWTIGGWFIPLANAVIPCLVMCEIWNRTDSPSSSDAKSGRRWVGVLVCWVIFVVGLVAVSIDISTSSISSARTQDWINLVGSALLGGAAVYFALLVRGLARRQVALADVQPGQASTG